MQIRSRVTSKGEKRYTVRYRHPLTGKWTEQVAGSTLKTAQALKTRLELEIAQGTFGIEPETPEGFSSFCDSFLKAKEMEVKPATLVSYRVAIEKHLKPYFGDMPLTDITPARVQEFMAYMAQEGVSPATKGKVYRTFKVVMRRAITLELIDRDPTIGIKAPRNHTKEMAYLDAEEVKRLLEAAKADPFLHALISIAVFSGLRVGEIVALRWSDIDLDAGVIRVSRSHTRQHGYSDPKTYASRRAVPVIPTLTNTLKAYHEAQGRPAGKALLFPGLDGEPFDAYNLMRNRFKPLLKTAKVKEIRFHDLRHTYAALCIAAGMDPKALQRALGHSSIVVTMDRYAHLLPGTYDRPLARLEAMISGGDGE